MKDSYIYAADFETTTDASDCRVWAWCCTNINEPDNCTIGTSIESFNKHVNKLGSVIIYFHNLKFDGMFLLDYWLRRGYIHRTDKELNDNEFSTLISDSGQWYAMKQRIKSNIVEYRDSLKIIPIPIEEFSKTFNIPEQKLEINYSEFRCVNHELTEAEINYIKSDTIILAKALKIMISRGFNRLTCGSNAYYNYKSMTPGFSKLFPVLAQYVDRDIRKSYKGGWTYLNKEYRNKKVFSGEVYDVNSMYPWAMKYCALPYGNPVRFSGEYKKSEIYNLYVVEIECEFKLKKGKFPSIQIKNSIFYSETEYIEESEDITTLILTSVDLELFFECYDVNIYKWCGGYAFKSKVGLFSDYIDYWYNIKSQSKIDGNKGYEFIAKRMLNSLYGKYGSRGEGRSKIPYLDDGVVRFKLSELENRKAGYVPVASFITSYCRDKIIRAANSIGSRFIYADTDSIHILAGEKPNIDIDEYRLGAFKLESRFIRAKFIRQKTYMEIDDCVDVNGNHIELKNIKCAGMPKKIQKRVDEIDFCEGSVFNGKLLPEVVPGGVILKETTFEIKGSKKS
ncbi:MAG: DNA polymerase [Podoviridae sp. ctbd591]|nr:MAG: DNA polymerase [Podoviridae sp. ctbd591]